MIDHETRIKIAEWAYGLAQEASLGKAPRMRHKELEHIKERCDAFAATGNLGEPNRPQHIGHDDFVAAS